MAEAPARFLPARYSSAAVEAGQVQFTFVGHSTFLITSPEGVTIATDYTGYAGRWWCPGRHDEPGVHALHRFSRPGIEHVLRGWNPEGGPARQIFQVGDVLIRNVTTDIRGGARGRIRTAIRSSSSRLPASASAIWVTCIMC